MIFDVYCAFNDYLINLGYPSLYLGIIGFTLGFITVKLIKSFKNIRKEKQK